VETFTEPKELVENPDYVEQRRSTLSDLTDDMIDRPIVELVKVLNQLPFCYTMQSCYGHFLYDGQTDPANMEPLPAAGVTGPVQYRIAYICFCVENSSAGRGFLKIMRQITEIDPDYIQFCCAEWFWDRHVNTYALQVEPDRFKRQDTAELDFAEALRVERVRDEFFARLRSSVSGGNPDRRAD